MPPVSRIKQIHALTQEITRGLALLPNSKTEKLGLDLISHNLQKLRELSTELRLVAENSYANSAGLRHHLYNVHLSINRHIELMEAALTVLAEDATNEEAINELAMCAALVRTVKLAPVPKSMSLVDDLIGDDDAD